MSLSVKAIDPDYSEAKSLYEGGMSITRIAARQGLAEATVRYRLKLRGVTLRPHGQERLANLIKEQGPLRAQVVSLYKSGESPKRIGKAVGISPSSVRYWLRQEGVQLRQLSEAQTLRHVRKPDPIVLAPTIVEEVEDWPTTAPIIEPIFAAHEPQIPDYPFVETDVPVLAILMSLFATYGGNPEANYGLIADQHRVSLRAVEIIAEEYASVLEYLREVGIESDCGYLARVTLGIRAQEAGRGK